MRQRFQNRIFFDNGKVAITNFSKLLNFSATQQTFKSLERKQIRKSFKLSLTLTICEALLKNTVFSVCFPEFHGILQK